MRKKAIVLTMVAALSTGSLAACNTDQEDMNQQPEDVNYDPVRYDNNMDDNMDRRDIRQPGERDTPNNMDEEEPDLDEEPSEQRRQDQRRNNNNY